MKTEKFNYQGFKYAVIGNVPRGHERTEMAEQVKLMNVSKGTFKMQVVENGWKGTISTIKFEKI